MKLTGNEPINPIITEAQTSVYSGLPDSLLNCVENTGLTIRQHYAGLAMLGYLSSYDSTSTPDEKQVAKYAFLVADAMIAELNKDV